MMLEWFLLFGFYEYINEFCYLFFVSFGSFIFGEGFFGWEEGYDFDFIIRDEKYDCLICFFVLRDLL